MSIDPSRASRGTPRARSDAASPLERVLARLDAAADSAAEAGAAPATSPPDSVATGFASLDKLLGGGLRAGDLVVVGGDVGSGKSAFALAVALRAALVRGEGVVAFFSGEMTVERVAERVLAIEGRARIDDLRHGTLDDAARAEVGAAAHRLRDSALLIERVPAGGVDALADELRRTLDVSLAVVDPIEALASGSRERAEELAAAAVRLKELALEMNTAIVATAQLPALARDRPDLRPRLDDFGALGAVKQHADIVLGLFREEMYAPGRGVEGATELLALKNRNGPTGYVDLYFYQQWMRFEDMLDPER
jgi:replicative DNA helicase